MSTTQAIPPPESRGPSSMRGFLHGIGVSLPRGAQLQDRRPARVHVEPAAAPRFEAIGRQASGIAHDFNNVLGSVLACAEMLADEETDAAARARYARNMLGAVAHGRHLVEQILAFARGEQRCHAPIDARPVVAGTLELLRVTLPASVHLRESIGTRPLTLMADADELQRMVSNLCGNAVHAMKDGGVLHVALDGIETASPVALSHGALEPVRYVRIRVEDSGCGMDEATLARIFEPLFSTRAPGQGSGLGLAVVQRIVADLAGAIDVQSVPGAGSVFTIYIPAARE